MPTLNLPSASQMETQNNILNLQVNALSKQNDILKSVCNAIAAMGRSTSGYIEGGIPFIQRRRKVVGATTVSLYWKEPDTSFADWTKTVIVKKLGASPITVDDGTTVVTNTTRNAYADTPYVDTQSNGKYWYYKAFIYINDEVVVSTRLNEFEFWLFGCKINETDSVPSTMISGVQDTDNYFYDKPYMNFTADQFNYGGYGSYDFIPFAPHPCMLKSDGEVDYYLDIDDYTKKEDGVTASDVTDTTYDGNAMAEWPRIWLKSVRTAVSTNSQSTIYMYICSEQLDSSYECWPCKKSDGTYAEHFYLPLYEGSYITGTNNVVKLRSMSTGAVPGNNQNAETEATRAIANGTGWNTTTWAQESLMRAVYSIFFMNSDSQTALSGTMTTASSLQRLCGELNTTGMFYGKDGAYSSKFFGMENWWGHRWRRCNGCMLINGQYYIKLTESTIDGSASTSYNRTGDGYIASGAVISGSAGYIKCISSGKVNGIKELLTGATAVTGGSSTTYYCDQCYISNSGVMQLFVGGHVNLGTESGVFSSLLIFAPSYSYWYVGASLSYTIE